MKSLMTRAMPHVRGYVIAILLESVFGYLVYTYTATMIEVRSTGILNVLPAL